MPEGEVAQQPKKTLRPKKERANPLVKAGPAASAEERAFRRIAKEKLKEAHVPIEAKRERVKAARSEAVERGWAAVSVIEGRIGELEKSLVDGIPQVVRQLIETQLETQRTQLAEQQAEVDRLESQDERRESSLEQEPTFVEKENHSEIYAQVERELKWAIDAQRGVERLLGALRGPYESWTATTTALKHLGPFLENAYLEKGAVEDKILEQFLQAPEALPKEVRERIERGVRILAEAEAARLIPAAITDKELRATMLRALVKDSTTPEKRKALIDAYSSSERDAALVDVQSPDAAMVAIREVTLTKGALTVDEVRYAAGMMLAKPGKVNFGKLSDEDRAGILQYRRLMRQDTKNMESIYALRPMLDRLELGYNTDFPEWQGPYEARKQLETEESVLTAIEKKREEIDALFAAQDGDALVLQSYTQATKDFVSSFSAFGFGEVASVQTRFENSKRDIRRSEEVLEDIKLRVAELSLQSPENLQLVPFDLCIRKAEKLRKELRESWDMIQRSGVPLNELKRRTGNATFGAPEEVVHELTRDFSNKVERALDSFQPHTNELVFTDRQKAFSDLSNVKQAALQRRKEVEEHMVRYARECRPAAAQAAREQAGAKVDVVIALRDEMLAEVSRIIEGPLKNSIDQITAVLDKASAHYTTVKKKREEDVRTHDEEINRAHKELLSAEDSWNVFTKKEKISKAEKEMREARTAHEEAKRKLKEAIEVISSIEHTRSGIRY